MFSSSHRARSIDVGSASAEGRLALARVLRVEQGPVDTPVRLIRLLVVPQFGAAFEVQTTNVTDLGMRRGYDVDEVVVVALEHAAPARVVILDAPPREWAVLAGTDSTVRTVPTAASFEPPGGAVSAPPRRRSAVLAVVGVLLLVGLVAVAVPLVAGVAQSVAAGGAGGAGGAAPAASATATPAAPADCFTAEVAREGFTQLEAVIGGTQVSTLTIRRDSIRAVAPSTPGASMLDAFGFTGGEASRTGPSPVQLFPGETIERNVFDLAALDPALLAGMLARASQATGIADPGPAGDPFDGPLIIVSRFAGAEPTVQVLLQGDYGDGTVTFDLHGTVVRMDGGVPGSESRGANSN